MTPESFFHVALKVDDVEESQTFYRELFDAELLERGYAEGGEGPTAVNHVALAVADKRLYLFDRAPYEAAGLVEDLPVGFLHFGYVVDDVEASYDELTRAGAGSVMPPTAFGDGTIAFVTSPADVRIELLDDV